LATSADEVHTVGRPLMAMIGRSWVHADIRTQQHQAWPRYALARLHRGRLDGDLVQAPLNRRRMPTDVIGVPVPVRHGRPPGVMPPRRGR